jgi:hypothetical protein
MFRPDSLPAPLAAALQSVRGWTDPDAESSMAANSPDERAAWVAGLQQLRDAVDAAMLTAVATFDAAGDGETLHGAASTASWLRGAIRLAPGDASERVRLARRSRDALSAPAGHLRSGSITYDHLRSIDRAVRFIPEARQAEAVALLTDLAVVAPVADVRTAGKHLKLVADPDGTLADCEQQFERRHLTLSPLLDGMTSIDGLLDAESAALLNAALEPFLVPTGPDDPRSAAQRRADGLTDIVRTACDHRLLPLAGGERPHLQVLVASRPADREGEPTGAGPSLRLAPGAAWLPQAPGGAAPMHPQSVARIACDAHITPVQLDPDGFPMALGRTQRVFSTHQRRLLALRDGACRFPGCSRPPAHTDAHHVHPWSAGGTTDVDNAVLLCRYHHRLVHEGGWHIQAENHPESGSTSTRGSPPSLTFVGPRGQALVSIPRGP